MLKTDLTNILSRHEGRKNAITRRQLRSLLNLSDKEDRKLRLVIGEIRKEGTPILFATESPSGYYIPGSYAELKDGMANMRSYIVNECLVLRGFKLYGNRYLAGEQQAKLI